MENIEQRVKKIVAEQLGVNEADVKNESSFVNDLGADSLDTVELVMALEEEGIEHPTALQQSAVPVLRREGNLVARASSGSRRARNAQGCRSRTSCCSIRAVVWSESDFSWRTASTSAPGTAIQPSRSSLTKRSRSRPRRRSMQNS